MKKSTFISNYGMIIIMCVVFMAMMFLPKMVSTKIERPEYTIMEEVKAIDDVCDDYLVAYLTNYYAD